MTKIKQKMSPNELYQWKLSPSDMLWFGLIGMSEGWEGVCLLAIGMWIWKGCCSIWVAVKES